MKIWRHWQRQMTIENMSKSILAEICRDTVLGNGKPSWHGMTSCKNDISRTRMKCPCCLAVSSQSFDVRFLQLVKSPMFHVCLGSSWTETQANHSIHYKIYKFIAELRPYEVGHTWKLEEAWLRYIKWFADSAISRTNSLLFQGHGLQVLTMPQWNTTDSGFGALLCAFQFLEARAPSCKALCAKRQTDPLKSESVFFKCWFERKIPGPPRGTSSPGWFIFQQVCWTPIAKPGGRLDFPSNQKSNTKDNIPTYLWNRKKLKACCKWFHHLCIRVWHFLTCKKSDEIRRKLRSFFTKISKDSQKGKSTKA